MSERLNNLQIEDFLQNYGEIEILEEGKEKSELEKIAEARGIKIKGSRDLAIFKTIWAFTDVKNANNAILPHKELLKVLPQIVGKPINKNHDRRYVLGHYIDYRLKQKENKVIAYGIFYKSNFGEEFEEAKKLFKKKKLASSFEIWSPKAKRKYREDGSYELYDMEIAGGALIFMDKENEPAFPDAKILEFSKKLEQEQPELIYAKKYKEDEIITSAGEIIIPKEVPTISKVKCSNCGEEFDSGIIDKIKCPKCFAILDKSGNMIYPPQIIDFKMLCPNCSTNNWLLLSKKEDKVKVKCSGCGKEYNLAFATEQKRDIIDKINFVYSSKVSCLQCHKPIYVLGTSSTKTKNVKCKKCGLEFSYDITHDRYKKISKIEEVIPKENKIDNIKESSEEGGIKMAKEKKVEKASENKVDKMEKEFIEGFVKLIGEDMEKLAFAYKAVKETPKTEVSNPTEKVEEPKVEEKSEVKEEKVIEAEVKVPQVESKIEETPKEEKPVDTAKEEKVEEQPEVKVEVKETPKAEESKVEKKEEVKVEVIKKETSKEEKPIEVRFEYEVESLNEKLDEVKPVEIEESARLTTEQRNALPDSMFAVVVKVKDKRTGKMRLVRMYPINDEAHVRNALARLGQPRPKATLKRLGVSIEAVKAKILRRARQLKMTQLLERYKAGVRKVANKVKELRQEKASLEKKVELYKTKAKTILERRIELSEDCELTDEEILNDDKFGKVKAEKELAKANAELNKGNDIVGSKLTHDEKWYADRRAKINEEAYKHINDKK